jgi:primosomal protein N' (replication factor Y)
MLRVGFTGSDSTHVIKTANIFAESVNKDALNEDIECLGPVPATIERIKGRTRWQMLLKGKDTDKLREIVQHALSTCQKTLSRHDTRIIPDVDPYSLF